MHTCRTEKCLCATQLSCIGFKEYIVHTGHQSPESRVWAQCSIPPQGGQVPLPMLGILEFSSTTEQRGLKAYVGFGTSSPLYLRVLKRQPIANQKGFLLLLIFFLK